MYKNLIFLHLPKNGGTTFHSILNRYYSDAETFWVTHNEQNVWNLEEFIGLPEEARAKIHLLKGHFMFGLHKHLSGDSDYITFLRKPVERTISFYNYVSRNPHNRLYVEAQHKSLFDFVTQVKDFDIVNGQIRKISGVHGSENEMLDIALENIERHFALVGLQEKFDEALVVLGEIYNWKRLYYKKQNVSERGVSVPELDDRTIAAIRELNNGDLKLYEIMEKRFEEKFSQIPAAAIKCQVLKLENRLYSLTG
jgi:hypothetical protein